MSSSTATLSAPLAMRRLDARTLLLGGTLLVAGCFLAASARGAYAITPGQLLQIVWDFFSGANTDTPAHLVFLNIRLPRLLLGVAAGAGLGLSGALMQGMFRNPLADPGLVGVSGGAALAAAVTIVLGMHWFPEMPRRLGSWTLMLTAFSGGLAVTTLIYLLAQTRHGTQVGMMLLAGIGVNALAAAGLGYLSIMSTDEQLRAVQFWLLGSLGGATWTSVALVGATMAAALAAGLRLAQPLNAIALGEAQASMLGVEVERSKRLAVLVTALAVGAVTATTGIIGFVGLVAPHAVRLLAGPDHRVVLPGSALLGAALVLAADAVARTVARPAELPLGVLTACVGVPFFLLLLRAAKGRV